jgi:hypothetical protein
MPSGHTHQSLNEYGKMLELHDNLFNQRRHRDESKLKCWRYAGLMLTYRCTAACRFCYYHCAPQAGGLMTVDTAIGVWEGLIRIAGTNARVHITGGEPFLYFDRLSDILKAAHRLKLDGLDSIETNADWGDGDGEIADKLRFLDSVGLDRLKISWDPFHEEFVDLAQVERLTAIARRVLGPQRVLVRWEHHLDQPSGIRIASQAEKERILLEALKSDPCRFTGRAAETLAPLTANKPADAFRQQHCQNALLSAKGVHVDPYGNVFNGQCSGMSIGTVTEQPLDVLWRQWQPDQESFWAILYHNGPFGFLKEASGMGYPIREKYASKCHLCTDIRRFFFDKNRYSPIISPKECYGKY